MVATTPIDWFAAGTAIDLLDQVLAPQEDRCGNRVCFWQGSVGLTVAAFRALLRARHADALSFLQDVIDTAVRTVQLRYSRGLPRAAVVVGCPLRTDLPAASVIACVDRSLATQADWIGDDICYCEPGSGATWSLTQMREMYCTPVGAAFLQAVCAVVWRVLQLPPRKEAAV